MSIFRISTFPDFTSQHYKWDFREKRQLAKCLVGCEYFKSTRNLSTASKSFQVITMGCKSGAKDPKMQRRDSQENYTSDRDNSNNSTSRRAVATGMTINTTTAGENSCHLSPNNTASTPQGQGHLPHSSTDPNLRGHRPRSAHHHRLIGQILRNIGDSYCYSCGIALRQMGDQLTGETEVRRAFSTGDLPSSVKNT